MATHCTDYEHSTIEPKWQRYWDERKTFAADDFSDKPKYYILDMFPYPSGAGLHIGHPEGYTASDILCRYKKAKGFNTLHPMGWDAFGLPAEQYAIQTGQHPSETTQTNIDNFRRQIKRIGFAIDWDREVNTTDPGYFKWTQWIFLQLFKRGLAYVDERPVWWCPALGTVLANEEIVDGKSERGSHPVERRALRQWVLRITAYADRLLEGLADLDWPESTKTQQTNWIGRSEGAEVDFKIDGSDETLRVYTTRPDTLYGATYMVIAPEHALTRKLTTEENQDAVGKYIEQAARKSDLDRTDLAKEKTGVFTGSFAINPVNGKKIPIWTADYVLTGYGTGAIMAVPAHDERDFEFAKAFDIPIIQVIEDIESEETQLPFPGKGRMVNSGPYDGMDSAEGKLKITEDLAAKNIGEAKTNFKLRDWLFSRQRYWGEPFPILWVSEADYQKAQAEGADCIKRLLPETPVRARFDNEERFALPLPAEKLPLTLPKTDNYKPSGNGESPLANVKEWLEVWLDIETGDTAPAAEPRPGDSWLRATRETNTMPQWAGSCWYYLRYCDPKNTEALIDPKKEQYWQAPDFYIGGAEHAVLHLLYARFWHQFLFDIGAATTKEPFKKLFHQGLILGEDGEKMSKSRGNVVNPDVVIDEHGADCLRLYEMFMGPLEDAKPWQTESVGGQTRFLRRVWRELIDKEGKPSEKLQDGAIESKETERLVHATIKKVTEDIENLRFNTAISQMMILLNHLQKEESYSVKTGKTLIQLLAPFAPHICEELWERYGEQPSVADAPWPEWDESKLAVSEVKIGILINGKPRGEAMLAKDATEEQAMAQAKSQERVNAHLEGKTIRKIVYVPGKILNIVAN